MDFQRAESRWQKYLAIFSVQITVIIIISIGGDRMENRLRDVIEHVEEERSNSLFHFPFHSPRFHGDSIRREGGKGRGKLVTKGSSHRRVRISIPRKATTGFPIFVVVVTLAYVETPSKFSSPVGRRHEVEGIPRTGRSNLGFYQSSAGIVTQSARDVSRTRSVR